MFINEKTIEKIKSALIEKHGAGTRLRIEKGVAQAASLWIENDGSAEDFEKFCDAYFIADDKILNESFASLEHAFEALDGHYNAMVLELRKKIDLDLGQLRPLDMTIGSYDPSAHLDDDLYANKLAFIVLLNFPYYSLAEKAKQGENWSVRQWAFARLGDRFTSRVPAELLQREAKANSEADAYIGDYNIYMGNLHNRDNHRVFPKDLKLITHWGLRDELKSHYGKKDGQEKQEIVFEVMNRIITQEIPAEVINNSDLRWNPFENMVYREGKDKGEMTAAEPDTRYGHILARFHLLREVDNYYPSFPTALKRRFEKTRELTESEVVELFDKCLSAPQFAMTAELIKKRLGRDLRPFDIWYDGFKARSAINEDELTETVKKKYPDVDAFAAGIPDILKNFDFSREQIDFIAPRIRVQASRGAGHAWRPDMKSWPSHLRTRVPKDGMDYKGFNVASHELGHGVEQVISVGKAQSHFLRGVPFTAMTEAFAFIFQTRDLQLLGMKNDAPDKEHLMALDRFWGSCEIMGVSLVEIKIWNWLYDHPEAGNADLKKATLDAAREVWNKYFAGVFGLRDEIILAIYSHMVDFPLYLPDYALGHLIEFQIEKYLEGKKIGFEMERICRQGNIIPQIWMKQAVGSEISSDPMLEAVDKALAAIK